jgi:hypothetical protein
MLPPLPRCSSWVYSSLISPRRISLPRFHCRVGLHIVLFEVCSAFTHVAACTLAPSLYFVTAIRRLQTCRHLHACPGCFQLERIAGWALHPLEKRRLVTAHVESGHSHRISARAERLLRRRRILAAHVGDRPAQPSPVDRDIFDRIHRSMPTLRANAPRHPRLQNARSGGLR